MIVEKGRFELVDGASFTGLSELAVSAGAVFSVASGSGADFKATTLTLGGATSRLELGAGVTIACTSATIDGAAMSPGIYAATAGEGTKAASWINGSGIVTVAEGPENASTWSGADPSSTLVTADLNWQDGTVPDLTSGKLLATFAVGGTEAKIANAISLNGMVCANSFGGDSFAFAAEGNATATVGGNGLTVAEPAAATTWLFGWPLAIDTEQTWTVATNNTVNLTAGFSGSAALAINNKGTVAFAKPSTYSGAIELDGGTFRISAMNALGTGSVTYHHKTTKLDFDGDITLETSFNSQDLCESYDSFMTVEPNARVTFNDSFSYRAFGGITFGADSVTTFKKGVAVTLEGVKGAIKPYGSGTVIITNMPLSIGAAWFGQTGSPITLELCAGNNKLNNTANWAEFLAGRLVTRCDNALDAQENFLRLENMMFDLDGHNQRIGMMSATENVMITSSRLATLTFDTCHTGSTCTDRGDLGGTNRVDKAQYLGQVSVACIGTCPHTFGSISSSTGSLEVTKSTLAFAKGAAWPNATEVRVSGSGCLRLADSGMVGSNAIWRVTTGEGATVNLAAGTINSCERLYVDGKRTPSGVYGSLESDADHRVSWIVGSGILKVPGRGIVIIFR